MRQPLVYQSLQQLQEMNKNQCRMCLGRTHGVINPCRCSEGYIHEQCLKIQISKQLKYHHNTTVACRNCLFVYTYRLIKQYRFRNCPQLQQFAYQNILPQSIMCLLLLIGLMLNQHCLSSVQASSFWMKVIKIYLVLVGVYLELLLLFVLWIVYESVKLEFRVWNYEVDNIQIL